MREEERHEREKLTLRLENALLKFERQLPTAKEPKKLKWTIRPPRLRPRISRMTRMGMGFQPQPWERIAPERLRPKFPFIRAIRGSLFRFRVQKGLA